MFHQFQMTRTILRQKKMVRMSKCQRRKEIHKMTPKSKTKSLPRLSRQRLNSQPPLKNRRIYQQPIKTLRRLIKRANQIVLMLAAKTLPVPINKTKKLFWRRHLPWSTCQYDWPWWRITSTNRPSKIASPKKTQVSWHEMKLMWKETQPKHLFK